MTDIPDTTGNTGDIRDTAEIKGRIHDTAGTKGNNLGMVDICGLKLTCREHLA
ncbi:hypothetical protein GCM10027180_18770 [Microbulbifer echini]